jgi:hypothetical protein
MDLQKGHKFLTLKWPQEVPNPRKKVLNKYLQIPTPMKHFVNVAFLTTFFLFFMLIRTRGEMTSYKKDLSSKIRKLIDGKKDTLAVQPSLS